ncbi:MAG TPA: glutamate-1-semialdehyde 2,1-aminomutase [Chitinophagales bacterium]|nr:glutamate-1-semialdehyde 2,1-aminomutase [Chitinophagales bacterium]
MNFFREAQRHIPGGVNSPVRSFYAVGGTPLFIESAKGAIIRDIDGNEYIDYVGSWGPMILGHAHPKVVKALKEATAKSASFGAPTQMEVKLAKLMKQMAVGLEMVRFVNSGTEACMSAIRLARAYTKRNKIIKFEGCYHGHADSFLIKAGSGVSTLGIQNVPGVPQAVADDTLVARFNDLKDVETLFKSNKKKIAAVIVEPVAGNMGCIPPANGFLEGLRKLCDANGALLIFDEVMTGFRVASGGAVQLYGVIPDLMTFGKIIGGGLPVGAYGGREDVMKMIAPSGNVYQAGTLSGNPLAMTAGFVTLSELNTHPRIYQKLDEKGEILENGLREVFDKKRISVQINRVGSMMSLHFTKEPVTDFASAKRGDNTFFKKFFHSMLKAGIYLPPSPFEAFFISITHSNILLKETIGAIEKIF